MINVEKSGTGIGFAGVLFIVFLILKLCNVIHWSWVWVTAPLWITVGIVIIICVIVGIINGIERHKMNKLLKKKEK